MTDEEREQAERMRQRSRWATERAEQFYWRCWGICWGNALAAEVYKFWMAQ